jgi:hypothetical protein
MLSMRSNNTRPIQKNDKTKCVRGQGISSPMFFLTYEWAPQARMFVTFKPFQYKCTLAFWIPLQGKNTSRGCEYGPKIF